MTAPARLLSVRLQGFKSFADRTHVAFGPGISAVVGPNGSGKSNLADALRWALGEQGRALRSRKSEDVIWAGSEGRAAVGMADVQLTLDNADALLPVEFGTVELGRRLYRSGENDYLLNRQRVRLKDLVDLLDAGHLAENAFLFIGQGMVDQALALRPEERRPLFEEVAGVRRHERRRRRAEEQLTESEANLARVDDILAELRPQARRLAQQAEQQANRLTAADDLVEAILLSAHARWFAAASRAGAAAAAAGASRTRVDEAMAALLEHERAMTDAGAALGGQATAEAAARTELDRVRAERATLQLREGRHASDAEGAVRERARIEETRAAAEAELAAARDALARPVPPTPSDLESELAALDAEIAAATADGLSGVLGGPTEGLSAVDAAAVRRLEAARAQDLAAARRRAGDAARHAEEESRRSAAAAEATQAAAAAREAAAKELEERRATESAAIEAREAAQAAVADAESSTRAAADRAAAALTTASATAAREADARRALEAAEGGTFSRAARAKGGRGIADGLIIDPAFQPAVDAVMAGLARAQVLPRSEIGAVAGERGVAIPADALERRGDVAGDSTFLDAVRARGGGRLLDAVRRDDVGAVSALIARAAWLPDIAACLELQPSLPAGWVAVARDGSMVAGPVATWLRPDGRGLHLQADVDRLATERARVEAEAATAAEAHAAAVATLADARAALSAAREAEARAAAARRRAEEVERAAAARAETTSRDAAWLAAQATRLATEAARLQAAIPEEPAPATEAAASTASGAAGTDVAQAAERAERAARQQRLETLRRQRVELLSELEEARGARARADRERAQADAAAALAERQLATSARAAADLAERESRLATEREDLVSLLATAAQEVARAEAALAMITAAAATERERLRAAEVAASGAREAARIAQERARLEEREDVEARLALEGMREQLLVELAGLGEVAYRQLLVATGSAAPAGDTGGDVDPAALETAVERATSGWATAAPDDEPPSPSRLATLRRRFHELGAVNPYAADEFATVRARLDELEGQRTDLQSAIDQTRELIRELDRLIADQFRRTFDALEKAFERRFTQLFGGGVAKLSLTDPQDLAATGIEITARPPGKKPQALAMLSGGERALTAVALLFSMLEVRPVPFCVLDEVDAALDEANIARFTDALRELSRSTQCIVITHNRGTIETADALYGVTVGEDSVSRVISLRLDEATALARRGHETGGTRAVPVGAAAEAG